MNTHHHFPITSARYELEEAAESLGQNFSSEIVPIGQISVRSGRLAVGDPLLGMSAGANPWVPVPSGAYSAILTRLLCLDREGLEIPAYLSLILDPEEVEKRRQDQAEQGHVGAPVWLQAHALASLSISEEGVLEPGDADDMESLDVNDADHSGRAVVSRSGVVALVDETAFGNRMPDPLASGGGWFDRYFDTQSKDSWLSILDDANHMESGVANISLPEGPEDWIENEAPTIALVQMAAPGLCQVFFEYAQDDHRNLNPIAVHVELGVHSSLFNGNLKPSL